MHPLRFAALHVRVAYQLSLVSHSAGGAESVWKVYGRAVDSGMLQEAVQITQHKQFPFDEARVGHPSLSLPTPCC